MVRLSLTMWVCIFALTNNVYSQEAEPGPTQCPTMCAVDDGTRSCATLYGAWPGFQSFGCHGVSACEPAQNPYPWEPAMECNGWSLRVDIVTGLTQPFWSQGYRKVKAAQAGQSGNLTDCPIEHECYIQIGCQPGCEYNVNTQTWRCKANPLSSLPRNVTEDRLKDQPCVGDFEA
jgi:hypothetical protein